MNMLWNIRDLASALGLRPLQLGKERQCLGLSIDSRSIRQGELFICIKGKRYDGHAYIGEALARGAAALLVSESYVRGRDTAAYPWPSHVRVFVCKDGLQALQELAAYVRRKFSGQLLAITGSNGKTSTRAMLQALLGALAGHEKVFGTQGNQNNHIGLALSLVKIQEQNQYAVLEMGMNHPGEIAFLSRLAKPEHAVISSIAGAHLAFFPDLDAIAQAKLEVLEGMPERGASLFYHAFSPGLRKAWEAAQTKGVELCLFGISSFAASALEITPEYLSLAHSLELSRDGLSFVWEKQKVICRHLFHPAHASNLVACLCLLSHVLGFAQRELIDACYDLKIENAGRFQIIAKPRKADRGAQLLVDDTYNANRESCLAAIRALRALLPDGSLALFLGEMSELGDSALQAHRDLGRAAAQENYSLLALREGPFCKHIEEAYLEVYASNSKTTDNSRRGQGGLVIYAKDGRSLAELSDSLCTLEDFDGILVKGSRSAKMEEAAGYLRDLGYV